MDDYNKLLHDLARCAEGVCTGCSYQHKKDCLSKIQKRVYKMAKHLFAENAALREERGKDENKVLD